MNQEDIVPGRRWPNADCLISHLHKKPHAVSHRVDSHSLDSHLVASPDHPAGNLSSVCNQNLAKCWLSGVCRHKYKCVNWDVFIVLVHLFDERCKFPPMVQVCTDYS